MNKISRSKLARFIADELQAGRGQAALQEVAAYLIETGRTREVDMVVRAVYDELETRGVVVATVTSREALDTSLTDAIKRLVGASELHLATRLDPSVIAGVRVETPSRLMDATVAHRLTKLREVKQ